MTQSHIEHTIVGIRGNIWKLLIAISSILFVLSIVLTALLYTLNTPPSTFPETSDISIEKGATVRSAAEVLEQKGLIRSSKFFRLLVRNFHKGFSIQAGHYYFEYPISTSGIIEVFKQGAQKTPEHVLTFPEGFSVHDLQMYTKNLFPEAEGSAYIAYEGFLFPETYFVAPTEKIDDLIMRMRDEYELRIAPYRDRIKASSYTEAEVIILASILEREANDEESMKTVAGILENRLAEDIPLQVDATFEYILGKTSEELTMDDLALESPYNTYIHTGLPPTPIANPGILAIESVLSPRATNYYYYLTDNTGVFHYAETFEEHVRNKELYLN